MSKRNKKSFSDNLEFLFQERMLDDNAQDNLSMIENEDDSTNKKKGQGAATATSSPKTKTKKGKKAKTHRKSFSSSLERFFKDSIDGVLDGVVTDVKRSIVGKGKKKAIGLDLLIQRTTEESIKDQNNKSREKTTTKRVTVVLDTEKLEELKRIAKEEKRRLHHIIGELVAEYIDNKE